jgi:hypothetical protein
VETGRRRPHGNGDCGPSLAGAALPYAFDA